MRRPRFSRFLIFLAAGVAAIGLAACSSGSSGSTAATSGSSQGPEKTTITVDTTDSEDAAPLWIAIKDGFFAHQGLTVKINYVSGTGLAFPGQAAHTVDFALQNYVSLFTEMKTNPALALRIIAPDVNSAEGTEVLLVAKNSSIKSLADLKGKIVGVPSPGFSAANLYIDEQLKGYGIGDQGWTADPVGFTAMGQQLESGALAATFSISPFTTILENQGAHQLIDLMTGPLANFPTLGWTTTAYEEQHYPRTVAAFQRAIEQGLQVAASNTTLVRQITAQKVSTLSAAIANIMPLDAIVTTLSKTSVQRVATTMEQFGANILPPNYPVAPLITPLPAGS